MDDLTVKSLYFMEVFFMNKSKLFKIGASVIGLLATAAIGYFVKRPDISGLSKRSEAEDNSDDCCTEGEGDDVIIEMPPENVPEEEDDETEE
jgi:hypothetical protein